MKTLPETRRARWTRSVLVIVASLVAAASLSLTAQQPPDLVKSVVFREIGPTRQGGRFVDFAVVEATPRVFYAATATGGLWKTENNGMTFTPLLEARAAASIGAVAVSQSNPAVVYVGSGEANNSRSSYWGDGVYVSNDAGASWTNVGLKNSHHIGRIVIHPTDPNTVYVAALGRLYSDNAERGLYKTTDGGKTWAKSLAVKSEGKDIGVVDVAMDPKNPLVLYAAAYDKVRRPWTFAEGGPGSGLYKTIDAGKTWIKLTGGLPTGMLGRIGMSIFRQDPNVVYTIVENANCPPTGTLSPDERKQRLANGFGDGSIGDQLFRSDDAGKTWRQVAPAPAPPASPAPPAAVPAGGAGAGGAAAAGQAAPAAPCGVVGGRGAGGGGRGGFSGGNPPYYYGQVRVDPNDKNHVFVLSAGSQVTSDGGATWTQAGLGGDSHALWINPKDSNHMLNGYDHGMTITFDGGRNWTHPDNLPHAQYYAVGFDMDVPYNVYGGLQDNGSVKGPSTRRGGGAIPFEDWTNVGGGDGMYNVVSWADSRWLYNESQFGVIQRVDQLTGQSQSLQAGRPAVQDGYRWNWNAPILVSPHNPDVVYHAAQVVLRSPFRGDRWEAISPDLTVNDPAKRGGSGNITYATITSLDESPIVPGLLWAGTDDGNVQVTRNGGQTWTNVRDKIPGHPGYWVSRVVASNAAAGTAYVTVTGYRNDDFKPFIWKTTDFGQTWTSIAGNLPQEAINVVRESPRNANVLFAGTDLGVHVSINGGQSWQQMRGAQVQVAGGGGRGGGGGFGGGAPAGRPRGLLPIVPVHDLKIHPRDRELIVGTHGRGIFIADISEIEEVTPAVLAADGHLFEVDPVIDWVVGQRPVTSSSNYTGMSRPTDMGVSYYLKADVSGDVKVRIYAGSRVVAELDGAKTAGINTVRWNLQARRERVQGEAQPAGRGGRGGGGGFGVVGPPPDPNFAYTAAGVGTYRVVLSVGGREYSQPALILADPGRAR